MCEILTTNRTLKVHHLCMFRHLSVPRLVWGNNPISTIHTVTQSKIAQDPIVVLRNQFVKKFFMNKPDNDAIENSTVLNNIAIN